MKTRRKKRARVGAGILGRLVGFTLKLLLFVGFLGGLGYGAYTFAETSEHFRIRTIDIEGESVLGEQTIREACGVTEKNNVIFLRAGAVRARVEALPYVKACDVKCIFPDKLIITVVEREAVATVELDDRFYAVDADGRLLEEIPLGESLPGPLVTDLPDSAPLQLGDALPAPVFGEALAVWQAFETTAPAEDLRLSEISARALNDIRMYFENLPYYLCWGRGDYQSQARRLDTLWKSKSGHLECRNYLDLRFGQDLVCN